MRKTIALAGIILFLACAETQDCRCEPIEEAQKKGVMSKGSATPLSGTGTEGDPYLISLSGMTGQVNIEPSSYEYWETTGDLNLNGNTIEVANIQLFVNGYLNGGGTVNASSSTICIKNAIQNNPTIELDNSVVNENTNNCSSLGVDDYEHYSCPEGQTMICE
jgi:hypothetical protein